jgi:hypothetical protein
MNGTITNYLRWVVVLAFLVLPPFFVRNFVNVAPAIRVVTYCLLIVVLTSLGLFLALRRGDIVADMPIAKELKTEKSKRIVAAFFRGLVALMVIAGMFLLANVAPSIALYALRRSPAVTEVHTITHIDSPALPGAFYIYMNISTDDKTHLSFSYPHQILQTGHKYLFTMLPNSNFVLSATEAK